MSEIYKKFCVHCRKPAVDCTCRSQDIHSYLQGNLCQCSSDADALLDNFRNDVSCRALNIYESRGLTLSDLLAFQKKVPIIYPWDSNYDSLRYNVNRRFVVFPIGIVMAVTNIHIVETINFVCNYNLRLVARSGSHCFENFSLTDGIILDQSRRTNIQLCVEKKIAKLELGCLIGPLQKVLSEYSLAFVGGTCPNNSVSLIMGGGIGFLIRQYGLSSDNLIEAEIALADGSIVKANKEQHSDLFWALQGAGNGNFGIITELVVKLHVIPRVIVFDLKYKYNQLKRIVDAWQRWAPFTTSRLSSELDVYKDHILVTGQYIYSSKLSPQDNQQKLELLLESFLADAYDINIKMVDIADATRFHGGIGYWLPFFKNKSTFVQQYLPEAALEIIEKYMQKSIVGPEDHIEMNAFGGFMDRIPENATAFPWRKNTLFWMHFQCHWQYQEMGPAKIKWVTALHDKLAKYTIGAYFNAPDIALNDYMQAYFNENRQKLVSIKKKYDPTNFFQYQQSIPIA